MPIDAKLLTLTQWLSPAYPVGAFAFSHGLESAVRDGWVRNEAGLAEWFDDLLRYGAGRADAILIRRAAEGEDPDTLDAEARALQPSAERLREAERQGTAFATVTRDVWAMELGDWLLPVALGRAARLAELDTEVVVALYLQGFVGNLVSVAQRLMPLGQTGAQRVLAGLAPTIAEVAQASVTDRALWSTAWAADIAAMRHETLQPRIFQS